MAEQHAPYTQFLPRGARKEWNVLKIKSSAKVVLSNLYTVVTGAFINLAVILFLRLWTPNPDEAYVFFIIAAFWGISDAIWQTQINGMYFL